MRFWEARHRVTDRLASGFVLVMFWLASASEAAAEREKRRP